MQKEKDLKTKYNIDPNKVTIYGNNMNHNSYFNCQSYELLETSSTYPYSLNGYCMEAYSLHETGDCKQSQIGWNTLSQWQDPGL